MGHQNRQMIDEIVLEPILRRLKHLLESDYISSFDKVDPVSGEYKRDITEADAENNRMCIKHDVLYECDHRACSDKKNCNCEMCGFTSDITHAKNFELRYGVWVEKRKEENG